LNFQDRFGLRRKLLFRAAPHRLGAGQMQTLSDGCAVVSHGSSNRLLDRVLIRKSIQARIVNTWLVLIAVLGTVIVVADGFNARSGERTGGVLEWAAGISAVPGGRIAGGFDAAADAWILAPNQSLI